MWEKGPLWAKSRLFLDYAFNEPSEDPRFGLWCSLGLELLGRAAVASVSPTLLAEPDQEHKYLLHALGRGSERVPRKSIPAAMVFQLCRTLFPAFTDEDQKLSMALAGRRNEELHTGAAAFDDYKTNQWLGGFYRACKALAEAMGESLGGLLGEDGALVAEETIVASDNDVKQRVNSKIAAHRSVFLNKPLDEREVAKRQSEAEASRLTSQRHHRAVCPSCSCMATVQGKPFGKEHVEHNEDQIVVRQAVSPTNFQCSACGLALGNYWELQVANLGGQYSRRSKYSPEEYYGLINPDDIGDYLPDRLEGEEYDNE